MSSKFFNNTLGNTLFDTLSGIARGMQGFHRFLAVSGFFRSSGYFRLRRELGDVQEIRILVGINIDSIFRKHNKSKLFHADNAQALQAYSKEFRDDVLEAQYSPEVEQGILQMYQDLADGRLHMRIHATKDLHAKFYLCLPREHSRHSDGWVIMGSSNISASGLGITTPPRYELNVAMKDYDDVRYCTEEFDRLWGESIPLSAEDVAACRRKTHLDARPTPYQLYIKVLIDTFGDQVEDDFTMQLPPGFLDLKYQRDAVIQGYQMLMEHHGVFLADVVGLGKTLIATMIAKRFIEANGRRTNILVVHPPALEENWTSTFRQFGISRHAQFITNGSLAKVLECRDQYKSKEEFDLIIVDEAHGFRNSEAGKYGQLQKICKAPCLNAGLLHSLQKKVMLLSATPLNNSPRDLLHLLGLFQNFHYSTLDGVRDLEAFFAPHIAEYKRIMRNRGRRDDAAADSAFDDNGDLVAGVEEIYRDIRERVLDKVTVRRTRNNILHDEGYCADIKAQGIVFPTILPPEALTYRMPCELGALFERTVGVLTADIHYARYRGAAFLRIQQSLEERARAEQSAHSLAAISRVRMVKRLESSFYAFRKSLGNLHRSTTSMIRMFEQNKVIIAPEADISPYLNKEWELEDIIEELERRGLSREDCTFCAEDFDPEFVTLLRHDQAVLAELMQAWDGVEDDPKFNLFAAELEDRFLSPSRNISGKLVIFSESVDTLEYLHQRLTNELGRTDVLMVSARNRDRLEAVIGLNFDANSKEKRDDYNIIITSDVLAEGVNLHRSHVIVNYDSPWNATRLMQRIGRVNRIGSEAEYVYNYMFYPSREGNNQIQLYANALMKLQGFHSAFGEDAQVFSHEEIVRQFTLYNTHARDSVDRKIALLREVRELYSHDRKLYEAIKALPMKSRVMRERGGRAEKSVIYVSSNVKKEYYLVEGDKAEPISFLEAVDYLRAPKDEAPAPGAPPEWHYSHVTQALAHYTSEYVEEEDSSPAHHLRRMNEVKLNSPAQRARRFLRWLPQVLADDALRRHCQTLEQYIDEGIYAQLPGALARKAKAYGNDGQKARKDEAALRAFIASLVDEYRTMNKSERHQALEISDPQVILSESFI